MLVRSPSPCSLSAPCPSRGLQQPRRLTRLAVPERGRCTLKLAAAHAQPPGGCNDGSGGYVPGPAWQAYMAELAAGKASDRVFWAAMEEKRREGEQQWADIHALKARKGNGGTAAAAPSGAAQHPAPVPLPALSAAWPPLEGASAAPGVADARAAAAEAAAAAAVQYAVAAAGHEAAAEAALATAATQPAMAATKAAEEWIRAAAAWRLASEALSAAQQAQPGSAEVAEAEASVQAARRFKQQRRGLRG